MRSHRRSRLEGGDWNVQLHAYGVALLCVAIALATTLLLLPWLYPTTTPLFLLAVMVAAWSSGWQAGLVTTVLSTLAINYFLMEPFYSLRILNLQTGVRLGVFLAVAGLISSLTQSRRNALKEARGNLQALQSSITREQSALAAAEAARTRLEIVLSSINDGFYVLDRDWRFTYVNDRYCAMVQMQASALIGRTLWEVFPAAIDTEAYRQFHRALEEQIPLQFDYLYAPWNCWHDHRIYPSLTGLTVLIADITARKQAEQALQISEERLQLAVTSAKLGMWFWEIETDTLIWTQRCKALFGLPQDDSVITYADFMDVLHPDDRPRTDAAVTRAMQDRLDYDIEYRAVWQDGSVHWIAAKGSCVYDSGGQAIRMNGVVIDIDDRKRTELNDQFLSQIEARLRQLADADQMLWETMSCLGEYLAVDRCTWHGIDPDNGLAIVEQDWRRQDIPSAVGVHPLSQFILPALLVQYQAGQTVVVSDVTTHPDTAPLAANYLAFGTRALIATPCLYKGRWLALLVVNASLPRNWRSDEVELLQAVVVRLWSLIEHTRIVQELRRSETEFRQLANAMPQIVYVANPAGGLEFVNDRWIEYTGLTLAQSREGDLIQQVIPREDLQRLQADFEQAQADRSPYQSQFRLIQPDGSPLHFLTRAIPLLDPQGQVCKWYGTSTDITGLKQLEVELRQKNAILDAINESAPTPIFVKDRQGRIIYANPATLEVLGKSAAEVIGHRDCDLYPSTGDALGVMENDRRIMESGQMEVVEESPDGIRTFLGMKVAYRNEAGEVIGLIGISNDITDRVQLERDRERILQQEQAARETAENANRIKDEFLAVLSHELRSPLNPILGWTRLLQTGKLDPAQQADALATIERNAKLQSQLIEDLLDISRIMQGKLTLTAAPLSLMFVISAAIETVRLAAEAKNIGLALDLDSTIGLVSGDAARLQQVVWNLLTNAVKFTPNGGQVTVELKQVGQFAQLRVSDTGKGIKPQFLPHVFEYFRQEDGSTTRKFGGLGLGLAIVRQIVEMHGGTVRAESQGEHQGATFIVQLPVMQQVSSIGLEPTRPPVQAAALLDGVQVLLVDDDDDSRAFQAFLLEHNGAKVQAVASGSEALQVLEQFRPDILISDVGMAEMDGYLLIQKIRSRPANQGGTIPAIALTAYAAELDQQRSLQAGFQKHLTKPIDPELLVSGIVNLLK